MNIDLIYDIGMNNGDDTAYYLYKGYRVIAIEADPVLCSTARIRFQKEIRAGRVQIVNAGIAPERGILDFWICEGHSIWNSFDKNSVSKRGLPFHAVNIPCETIESIFQTYGIPIYMKVDIEGFDHLCIDGLQSLSTKPRYVSCEVSDLDRTLSSLCESGYNHYKLIYQASHIPIEIPPSKEQRKYEFSNGIFLRGIRKGLRLSGLDYIKNVLARKFSFRQKWAFSFGSSGPFGAELPGRWLSKEETIRAYRNFQSHLSDQSIQALFRSNYYSNWIDLHACKEDGSGY